MKPVVLLAQVKELQNYIKEIKDIKFPLYAPHCNNSLEHYEIYKNSMVQDI